MARSTAIRPRTAALVLALAGLPSLALAQGAGNDYCVRHNFKLRTHGNLAPAVFLNHKEHSFARTNNCIDDDPASGSVAIGLGVTTRTVSSLAPGSAADATAEAGVTVLAVGGVEGWVEARGNANPSLAGCPAPNPPRGSGRATAFSGAQVTARGRYLDSRGNIRWSGNWKNSLPAVGSASRGLVADPILATVIDHTTGLTSNYKLLSIQSRVGGGETSWDGITLDNTASESFLAIDLPGTVTTQAGTLRIIVSAGFVTESSATGVFAALPIPAVGAPAAYSFPLPEIEIDYDLGANPNNNVEVELSFDGAGEVDKAVSGAGGDVPTLITTLLIGPDRANISEPLFTDTTMGLNTVVTTAHVADDFVMLPGAPTQLERLELPFYQPGAPVGTPIQAAFVRLWNGRPGAGGVPIAGDMATNRLIGGYFLDLFRVMGNPLDPSRAVNSAQVDLSWMPPLPPGRIWIEVATVGMAGFGSVMTVPAPYRNPGADDAMVFNVATNNWTQAQDAGSGRPLGLGWTIYASTQQPTTCYANCDQSSTPPVLNVNDFTCFLNKFAAGDPYANCDQSTVPPVLNVNDFTCFMNRFAAGCN
ncbi:MAG: GC-type dockerin domain-anchored protein [Phycisphaerales bacterium]